MKELFELKGKKAVVTGAAGGIGQAFVKALLRAGVEVAMLDMDDSLKKVMEIYGSDKRAHFISVDLMDRVNRERAFDQAVNILDGSLDILINSAGVQKRGAIQDFTDEMWDFVMEVNLNAVFSLIRCAGKYMIPQKSGKIINIASMNSYFGGTYAPAYASTKGAIVQLTKAAANEWSKFGINVNAIAPGFIETPMTQDMQKNPETYENKKSRIPMGRWGTPEDLIGTLLFLCAPASDYLCGVTIPVDGGYLCK